MTTIENKKIASITITHWRKKFDKAIRILLQGGISDEQLIEEIKKVKDEKTL